MTSFLLHRLLAGVLAFAYGAVSLWLLGTAWWSVLIAVLAAVSSYCWDMRKFARKHQPEVSRG